MAGNRQIVASSSSEGDHSTRLARACDRMRCSGAPATSMIRPGANLPDGNHGLTSTRTASDLCRAPRKLASGSYVATPARSARPASRAQMRSPSGNHAPEKRAKSPKFEKLVGAPSAWPREDANPRGLQLRPLRETALPQPRLVTRPTPARSSPAAARSAPD